MLSPNIINAQFRGVDYTFPVTQGTAGTVLKNDGAGNLTWGTDEAGGSGTIADNSITRAKLATERLKWDIFEEFFASGFGGNFTGSSATGGGAFVVAATQAGRIGEAQVQTGTTANGRGAITSAETILFSATPYTFEVDGLLLNNLNNGSDSLQLYIGFFDNAGNDNTPVDGAYVRYDAGSANWQICTRSNSTETHQTSSSAVAANTSYSITVTASTTGVSFFVNGVQIGTTITTNIPSGVGRDVSMGVKIIKRGGTGYRACNFDRFKFKLN